jgi:predicted RNase H-like nuclease (RuvC/YqgF family)
MFSKKSATPCTPVDGPKEHPVNFYFGNSNDMEEIKTKDNSSQAYLILQNNQLFSENAKLRAKIDRMRSEKETLGADCDNMERTKTCLKGLLHNEVEINDIQKEIRTVYAADMALMRTSAFNFAMEVLFASLVFAGSVALKTVSRSHGELILLCQALACAGTSVSALLFASSIESTDVTHLEKDLQNAQKASNNLHGVVDEL